nr:DUF1015 domain-containing protein [Nonomuraea sp. SYSU D8015]
MGTPELPVPDGLVLRPFRGVRFAVEDPAKVTSPPYDLISDADVDALLRLHPNNVVRLILPCSPRGDSSSPPTGPEPPTAHPSPEPVTAHRAGAEPSATERLSRDPEATPRAITSPTPAQPTHTEPGTPHPPHTEPTLAPPTRSERGTAPPPAPEAGAAQAADPEATISEPVAPGQGDQRTTDLTRTDAGAAASAQPSASPLEARYAEARDTLRAWLDAGILVPDEAPALYVYEQSGPDTVQRGLIGDVALADPGQHIILPHEDVMPGPIADRLALMSTTQANLEPIFLLYDGGNGTATRLVDEVATKRDPLVSAHTEDGLTHRLWAITDETEIAAINADLRHRQALIADGHHRYATYRVLQRQERAAHPQKEGPAPTSAEALVAPWDFGLALLVDSTAYPPDLKAIHRVIPGLPLAEATAKARSSWRVQDHDDLTKGLAALENAREPAFLLADEKGAHLLTDPDPVQLARAMPADHSDRWNSLNTSILSEFILPRVWGMRDDEQAVRIVHHDAKAAVQLATRTGGTAVILKPLSTKDVLAVAAGGERVPRKSTSFGPKPRTGLVLRTFAID